MFASVDNTLDRTQEFKENSNCREIDSYNQKDTAEMFETHDEEKELGEFNIHRT